MSQIAVDRDRCKKDGLCIAVCPDATLRADEEGFPEEVPGASCVLCGHCVAVCTCGAITHAGLPEEAMLPVWREWCSPAQMDGMLMSRRSVREFKEQPVSRETLEQLLDVARRAPTAANAQKLHWIVISDAAKVKAISAECINWARDHALGHTAMVVDRWDKEGYDQVLRGAPTVVLACAPADWDWGKDDGTIALAYLELAAVARGLGACWAGMLTRVAAVHPPVRQLLALPEGYVVCGGLMLGQPKYKYQHVPPRKPLSAQWL
jgi:nitroreductase/NAD-dependent dihydropyrimidine dehydrogenase PreA subunit